VNFKRTAALAAGLSLSFGLSACGHTGIAPNGAPLGMNKAQAAFSAASRRARTAKGGTWTILVHMAANNNLYSFGLEDLNEMEAGLPEDGSVNVYVQFKGTGNGDGCVYHIQHDKNGKDGKIISEKVKQDFAGPNLDSGDAAQLQKFIEWGAKNAPADHTMVDVWDHGSGLFGANHHSNISKGFAWDDTSGNNMHTWDLQNLAGAFKAIAGKNLDIFGFDCCLMSHSELAYQLAGTCDFLAASEETEPGAGWDYVGWLKGVGAGDHTPAAVGSALTDSYVASYQGGSQGTSAATFATTDINAYMANVLPAQTAFVNAAIKGMGANKKAFQDARKGAQHFYNWDCADLGSFLKGIKSKDADINNAVGALQTAYKSAIVREGHTKDFPGATGNVMYFPSPGESINSAYTDASKIAYAKENWKDFLKAYGAK